MKREFKFRAWDKKEKKMFIVDMLNFKLKRAVSLDTKVYPSNWSWKWKNLELMQFTGLKDKNGKEIYEGDIVGLDRISDGRRWKVVWKNYRWFLEPINNMFVPEFGSQKTLEILGNIYEGAGNLRTN